MMLLFQFALKKRTTYGAEWTAISPVGKKTAELLGSLTTVHNGPIEYDHIYEFQLNFGGTPATLKLDFAKTPDGKGIVVGTQYDLGELGKTERGTSEPLGKNWSLSGQFTLTDSDGKSTTYKPIYNITITKVEDGEVKIELNSDILVTSGVKDPATLGITMTVPLMEVTNFKGNVEVTLPQGGAKIEMVDLLGNVVDSVQNLPTGTSNLHLKTPYNAGIYFIVLSGIEGTAPLMTKVIVQ